MRPSVPTHTRHAAALDTQVAYFAKRRPVRLQALDTPYIVRHYLELTRVENRPDVLGEILRPRVNL